MDCGRDVLRGGKYKSSVSMNFLRRPLMNTPRRITKNVMDMQKTMVVAIRKLASLSSFLIRIGSSLIRAVDLQCLISLSLKGLCVYYQVIGMI